MFKVLSSVLSVNIAFVTSILTSITDCKKKFLTSITDRKVNIDKSLSFQPDGRAAGEDPCLPYQQGIDGRSKVNIIIVQIKILIQIQIQIQIQI